jgi:hypothetical protein
MSSFQSKSTEFKNKDYAKQLLSSANFVAGTPLLIAADMLTDGACFVWEYETIFDELEELKCLPNAANRDKLMAMISCLSNPAFLWDAGVFKSMCQSLNGKVAAVHILEQITPAKVVYAMDEIDSCYDLYQGAVDMGPLYSDQPKIYMAGCAAAHGLLELPKRLSIASGVYPRFFSNVSELKNELTNKLEVRKHEEIDAYLQAMINIRDSQIGKLRAI